MPKPIAPHSFAPPRSSSPAPGAAAAAAPADAIQNQVGLLARAGTKRMRDGPPELLRPAPPRRPASPPLPAAPSLGKTQPAPADAAAEAREISGSALVGFIRQKLPATTVPQGTVSYHYFNEPSQVLGFLRDPADETFKSGKGALGDGFYTHSSLKSLDENYGGIDESNILIKFETRKPLVGNNYRYSDPDALDHALGPLRDRMDQLAARHGNDDLADVYDKLADDDEFWINGRITQDQFRSQGMDYLEASPADPHQLEVAGRELKFHDPALQLRAVDIGHLDAMTGDFKPLTAEANPALFDAFAGSPWKKASD
jgi:hypothetical protein